MKTLSNKEFQTRIEKGHVCMIEEVGFFDTIDGVDYKCQLNKEGRWNYIPLVKEVKKSDEQGKSI